MKDKEFEYCEEMEKRKHDDKLKELREVQLLSQHILDLQKDKGKLTDRVRELEAQIEKMKCCGNCTHKYCSKCKKKKVLSDVDYWELSD